jgi:hypothetical protein
MNRKQGYQDISCEIQKVAKSKSSTQVKTGSGNSEHNLHS